MINQLQIVGQKKTDINNIVIPKSGSWINKKEDNKKIGKMILKPKFFPSIPLVINHALIITKNGFRNSEGWIDKLGKINHLFAPFISWPNKKINKIKNIEINNPKAENRLINFRFWNEKNIKKKTDNKT